MSTLSRLMTALVFSVSVIGFFGFGVVQAQSLPAEEIQLDGVVGPGDRGEQVRQIQELLAQHTDLYPEGLVSGYYGDLTAQAVSRLQAQADLPQVGEVGQETLDYLLQISEVRDDGGQRGGENRRSYTLQDTAFGIDFTANIQYIGNDQWQYRVTGTAPNTGYELSVSPDGTNLIGMVTQSSVGQDTLTDLSQVGSIQADSGADFSFNLRERQQGRQDGAPTARLSVEPSESVDTGEQFTVSAEDSTDPDDDELEYKWNIYTAERSGESGFGSKSSIQASWSTPGSLTFQVTVRDSDGNTDTESVTIQVGQDDPQPSNQPPQASDDSYAVTAGESIDVSAAEGLLANDTDPDGDELEVLTERVNRVSNPSGVQADFAPRGSFYLQVDEDYQGDTIRYRYPVTDGEDTAQATVEINVRDNEDDPGAPTDNPTANLEVFPDTTVDIGEQFRVDASGSTDPQGDELEYAWEVDTPRGGGAGGFTDKSRIQTSISRMGQAEFQVTVRDSDGNTDTESVTVQVGSQDTPPSDAQLILERTVGGIEEFPIIVGDVDENQSITAGDAGLIQDFVAGEADLTASQQVKADVDGDGVITDDDAQLILDYTVGSIEGFPVITGDVDENESVNTGDVSTIQDFVAGQVNLSLSQQVKADVNGDGIIVANGQSRTVSDLEVGSSQEEVTLRDTFRDQYEFTATVTQLNESAFQYEVVGSVPNSGFTLDTINNGSTILADIEQTDGPAQQVVTELRDTGRFMLDDGVDISDIAFEVRGDNTGAERPTADLEVFPDTNVDVGEEFRVDASRSTDPQGDELEYAWNVDTPRGAGGGGFSDRSRIQTSINRMGQAEFQATVRDSDGNTDTESVTIQVGQDDPQPSNQPPQASDDSYAVTAGESIDVSAAEGLLANDTDPDGDELEVLTERVNRVSNPSGVQADFAPRGSFYLQVDEDYQGDTIRYRYPVTDGEDTDQAVVEINVRESDDPGPTNRAPNASVELSAQSATVGEIVTADARGSSDPDGDSLQYEWKVSMAAPTGEPIERAAGSNDLRIPEDPSPGLPESPSRQSPLITESFAQPGVAIFSVQVTDSNGATDSDTAQVRIRQRQPDPTPEPSSATDAELIERYVQNDINEFPVMMGDVNEDGEVDNEDVETLRQYADGSPSNLSDSQRTKADVNGDGEITADNSDSGRSERAVLRGQYENVRITLQAREVSPGLWSYEVSGIANSGANIVSVSSDSSGNITVMVSGAERSRRVRPTTRITDEGEFRTDDGVEASNLSLTVEGADVRGASDSDGMIVR